jgi:hypothetical protein
MDIKNRKNFSRNFLQNKEAPAANKPAELKACSPRVFVKGHTGSNLSGPQLTSLGVKGRMGTRIRGAVIKSVSLLFVLACVCSCSDKKIEERLKSLYGNEYLALSPEEKSDIVKKSLDHYTTWKFWERSDLCDYVFR